MLRPRGWRYLTGLGWALKFAERRETSGSSGYRTPAGLSAVGITSVTNYRLGGNRRVVQEQLLLAPAAMETP